MDKRRTQRILGILVIIALVIILFPLLFSKNEVTTQTATIAAPSFPEQQKAPTTTANNNNTIPVNNKLNGENNSVAIPSQENQATSLTETNKQTVTPLESSNASTTSTINTTESTLPPAAPQENLPQPNQAAITEDSIPPTAEENTGGDQTNHDDLKQPAKVSSNEETLAEPVIEKSDKKPHPIKTSKVKKQKPIIHDVAKLNKPAWVVQMGSFKNKDNAKSLTDKLRASGYNAFTKEIKSAKGSARTRVYIGPEFKEAEAAKISQKVHRDLNLPSIVLPYKPLAL